MLVYNLSYTLFGQAKVFTDCGKRPMLLGVHFVDAFITLFWIQNGDSFCLNWGMLTCTSWLWNLGIFQTRTDFPLMFMTMFSP